MIVKHFVNTHLSAPPPTRLLKPPKATFNTNQICATMIIRWEYGVKKLSKKEGEEVMFDSVIQKTQALAWSRRARLPTEV